MEISSSNHSLFENSISASDAVEQDEALILEQSKIHELELTIDNIVPAVEQTHTSNYTTRSTSQRSSSSRSQAASRCSNLNPLKSLSFQAYLDSNSGDAAALDSNIDATAAAETVASPIQQISSNSLTMGLIFPGNFDLVESNESSKTASNEDGDVQLVDSTQLSTLNPPIEASRDLVANDQRIELSIWFSEDCFSQSYTCVGSTQL